jgi:hypothetical protein
LISASFVAISASNKAWSLVSSSVNLAIEAIKLFATSANKSATF